MRLELCGSILFQVTSYIVENVCKLLAKMNFESYEHVVVTPTLCQCS